MKTKRTTDSGIVVRRAGPLGYAWRAVIGVLSLLVDGIRFIGTVALSMMIKRPLYNGRPMYDQVSEHRPYRRLDMVDSGIPKEPEMFDFPLPAGVDPRRDFGEG